MESDNLFEDVNQDDYDYQTVLRAVSQGITDGISETEFAPDQDCTREQFVTFLYRHLSNNKSLMQSASEMILAGAYLGCRF